MKQIESAIIQLNEFYESKPVLKALIQANTYKDLPVGAFGDTVLSTYVSNLKTAKLRTFFEQLDNGEMERFLIFINLKHRFSFFR